MLDIGQTIRSSYFAALNGNITYEGSPVPIVDEKLDVEINEHDVYILMKDQTEDTTTNANKTMFTNECFVNMAVVNQRKSTNTKEIVEDVTNQILTTLFPDRTTVALSIDPPLYLTYAYYESGNYTPVQQNEKGWIIVKELRFKNRVTHT